MKQSSHRGCCSCQYQRFFLVAALRAEVVGVTAVDGTESVVARGQRPVGIGFRLTGHERLGGTERRPRTVIERDLEVECLPTAIPDHLRIEVSRLGIGDDLRVSDIQFPEDVKPTADPEMVVVAVVAPVEVPAEEAEEALEEIRAQPEVIGREAAEEETKEGTR